MEQWALDQEKSYLRVKKAFEFDPSIPEPPSALDYENIITLSFHPKLPLEDKSSQAGTLWNSAIQSFKSVPDKSTGWNEFFWGRTLEAENRVYIFIRWDHLNLLNARDTADQDRCSQSAESAYTTFVDSIAPLLLTRPEKLSINFDGWGECSICKPTFSDSLPTYKTCLEMRYFPPSVDIALIRGEIMALADETKTVMRPQHALPTGEIVNTHGNHGMVGVWIRGQRHVDSMSFAAGSKINAAKAYLILSRWEAAESYMRWELSIDGQNSGLLWKERTIGREVWHINFEYGEKPDYSAFKRLIEKCTT